MRMTFKQDISLSTSFASNKHTAILYIVCKLFCTFYFAKSSIFRTKHFLFNHGQISRKNIPKFCIYLTNLITNTLIQNQIQIEIRHYPSFTFNLDLMEIALYERLTTGLKDSTGDMLSISL